MIQMIKNIITYIGNIAHDMWYAEDVLAGRYTLSWLITVIPVTYFMAVNELIIPIKQNSLFATVFNMCIMALFYMVVVMLIYIFHDWVIKKVVPFYNASKTGTKIKSKWSKDD